LGSNSSELLNYAYVLYNILTLFLDVDTMCKWTVLPTFRSNMSFSRWGRVMSVRRFVTVHTQRVLFFSFFNPKNVLNSQSFFIFLFLHLCWSNKLKEVKL